jgi:hypothetical protein
VALPLAALVAGIACAGAPEAELDFADWILPVAEGTPVREYAPVARHERDPQAIVIEEDLVIGGDAASMFYSPPQIAVADDGRIYVLDREDASVSVFSAEGERLLEFGREGQGPGEMEAGRGITIAGEHVLVADGLGRTRILVFTLDGEPVASHQTGRNFGLHFHGLPDGTFVESTGVSAEDRSRRRVAGRYTRAGEELVGYFDLDGTPPRELPTTRDRSALMASTIRSTILSSVVRPVVVNTDGERVYATLGDEYQVLAMDLDGAPLWALRVAWPRPPYRAAFKEMHRERAARYEIDPDTLEFPPLDPAVLTANVDGHGRLFVYPNVGDQPPDEGYSPIDVYSPEGDLIAAGMGPAGWITAQGDHVYGWRHDEETDNWYVVRSRLTVNRR